MDVAINKHGWIRAFYKSYNSKEICENFEKAYASGGFTALEETKHKVMEESRDFEDLGDIIDEMPPKYKKRIISFFLAVAPPNYQIAESVRTIVISDLDNTMIENGSVAPIHYTDGEPIPGYIPFIKGLVQNTTATFISARPSILEPLSILSAKSALEEVQLPFSFQSGDLKGTAYFTAAMAEYKVSGRKAYLSSSWNRNIKKAAAIYASRKMQNYRNLARFFPTSTFVFIGDDTQGDYLFALALVNDRPQNRAFIRSAALPEHSINPRMLWPSSSMVSDPAVRNALTASDKNVTYFASYYDLILNSEILTPNRRFLAAAAAKFENVKPPTNPLKALERDGAFLPFIKP